MPSVVLLQCGLLAARFEVRPWRWTSMLVTHIPHPQARVDRDKLAALRHPWRSRQLLWRQGGDMASTPRLGSTRTLLVRCGSLLNTWTGWGLPTLLTVRCRGTARFLWEHWSNS